MKKALAIVAIAAVAAASCTKSEYLGNKNQKVDHSSPIEIGSTVGVPTKATAAESATLLSNKFVVYGQKTVAGVASEVFEGVPVTYASNEWSYVTALQALRYWDSNATSYDFIAISDANPLVLANDVLSNKVSPEADVYADGFSIAPVTADELAKIYTAAKKTVNQIDFSSTVGFEFANAAAKVRVGFYNAIPGYEVNVDKFFLSDDTETENTVLKGSFYSKAAYKVSNTGAVSLTGEPVAAGQLVLGNLISQCTNANQYIGKSLSAASFDKEAGAFTNVLPVFSNGSDITLKVSYRMISGHETIVRTCDVKIPAVYAKWQSNYAYTYLFKITDNDLHPITFSALVKDPQNQETVTTIDGDNPVNITIWSEGSDVLANNGVKVGKDVFVSVENAEGDYTVHSGFTTDDSINGSNASALISDWTLRTPTTNGRYLIQAQNAGYYVVRVTWTDTATSTVRYAYMVFKVVA